MSPFCLVRFALISFGLLVLNAALHADPVYGLFYRREFTQVGDMVFTNVPVFVPTLDVWARGFPPDDKLKRTRATDSRGGTFSLHIDDQGTYESKLASTLPAGAFTLNLTKSNDSIISVEFPQVAIAYPEIPKLNLSGLPIKARVGLRLEWTIGSDARADDVMFLWVSGVNVPAATAWEFTTGWPGQTEALNGLATTATIPGDLLKPLDMLQIRLMRFRPSHRESSSSGLVFAGSASGIATILQVPDAPIDNDVALYRLLSSRIFVQSEQPPAPPASGAFGFEAAALARAPERLTNVTLSTAAGGNFNLNIHEDNQSWTTNLLFDREDQILGQFPAGDYAWSFRGTAMGLQTAKLKNTGDQWPAPLVLANWSTLQTNSFTNDLAVRWTLPADARSSEQIELVIVAADGSLVLNLPDYAAGEPRLAATQTQLTIPKNKLVDGADYQARLSYIRVLAQDIVSISGATGQVARAAETRFVIGANVAQPLFVLSSTLDDGVVAEEYFTQLQASGGRHPRIWSITQGDLPQGLSMMPSGRITGFPHQNGIFHFVAQVTDALGAKTSRSFSLTITGELQPLVIDTVALSPAGDDEFYLATLARHGGVPPFAWQLASGRLPLGIKFHESSGMVYGVAEEAGSFPFQVQLSDGSGQSQLQSLTLLVPSATNNPPLRVSGFLPLNPSGASLRATGASSQRAFHLRLNTQPDDIVTIEGSTDLREWSAFLTTNAPAGGLLEWTYPESGHGFFRVRRGVPEPQYNPLSIQVTLDNDSTTAGILTSAGLTLTLTNTAGAIWRLELPPGCVLQPSPVTMTLVESASGFPFEVGFLGGVSFAPEGLHLLAPATLTASFPQDLPPDTRGFGFEQTGMDFHLQPAHVNGNVMTFTITHFSGAMGGTASSSSTSGMAGQNNACSSQSSLENQIAQLIDSGSDVASIWSYLNVFFMRSVLPALKSADQSDETLWGATTAFLGWVNIVDKYVKTTDPFYSWINSEAALKKQDGWKQLARAFHNAVERSYTRGYTEFRPFQAIRMMKLGQAARELGLGVFLEGDQQFFSEARMLEKFKTLFRFEFEIESSELSYQSKGSFITKVSSKRARIKPASFDYNSTDDKQVLTQGESGALTSEIWDLLTPENRVKPIVSSGSVLPFRLTIWPNYSNAETPGRCTQGKTWNDPTNPKMELIFDATDPVQRMSVETEKGTKEISILPKAGAQNWWGQFRAFHALQLGDENDASGQVHLQVPKIIQDHWDHLASGDLFAAAEFNGPPAFYSGGGSANESSTLKLYHAPGQ